METNRHYQRPTFEKALLAWQAFLDLRHLPTEILWIFDENLCFEKVRNTAAGFTLGFQTQFTPHPPEAPKVTYHHFAETDARLVFYRLGSNRNRSVCLQLCDPWFEPKTESDGYVRQDAWAISLYPGANEEIEEVTDANRWEQRVVRGRPLTAVDFCMTLAALNELKAHGRVLTPDERFGLKILRSMHRAQSEARP
jgi:hypothetical protein